MYAKTRSITNKLLKILIAVIVAIAINALLYLLSGGNIEMVFVEWIYANTTMFISLIALYIATYTYMSIDRVSAMSQMEGNPLEDDGYHSSLMASIRTYDAIDHDGIVKNLRAGFERILKTGKNPVKFTKSLQDIIDSLVLYSSFSQKANTVDDQAFEKFINDFVDTVEKQRDAVYAKYFIRSKTRFVIDNAVALIKAVLYYQKHSEQSDSFQLDPLFNVNEVYIKNGASKVVYYNYLGLFHHRAAIQMLKACSNINVSHIFTKAGATALLKEKQFITRMDKEALLIKLEDSLTFFEIALKHAGNCPVWKAYIYHNIARDRFLYDAINNTLSSSSWLNEMDRAIEYRWRVNHQLSSMKSENPTTHLKTYYAYQESLAKLIKYNLLMALNQPIYDTHGGMISKRDDYGDLILDIPITNYPRLKPYLAILKANAA